MAAPLEKLPMRPEMLSALRSQRLAIDPGTGLPRLGRYVIYAELGRGSMGVVYEVEDTIMQRRVAMKLLPEELADDERSRERFLSEARAAAKFRHPNAVGVLDVGCESNTWYLILELVRGGNVQELLDRRGPIYWREACRQVVEACHGLAAAHSADIIHRDIKPSNLMLTEDGTVKVSDFGLAKVMAGSLAQKTLTVAGHVVGTPLYMSPEQSRGEPLDPRSDLYSLGATFYACLLECRPTAPPATRRG